MSFNPTFNYTPARQLIIPNNGTEGWKTLGTIYNGVAGYMSWKDKQKQAERLQKAQDDYFELLKSYLNKKEEAPVDEPVDETVEEYEPVATVGSTREAPVMEYRNAAVATPHIKEGQDQYNAYLLAKKKAEDNMAKQLLGGR